MIKIISFASLCLGIAYSSNISEVPSSGTPKLAPVAALEYIPKGTRDDLSNNNETSISMDVPFFSRRAEILRLNTLPHQHAVRMHEQRSRNRYSCERSISVLIKMHRDVFVEKYKDEEWFKKNYLLTPDQPVQYDEYFLNLASDAQQFPELKKRVAIASI